MNKYLSKDFIISIIFGGGQPILFIYLLTELIKNSIFISYSEYEHLLEELWYLLRVEDNPFLILLYIILYAVWSIIQFEILKVFVKYDFTKLLRAKRFINYFVGGSGYLFCILALLIDEIGSSSEMLGVLVYSLILLLTVTMVPLSIISWLVQTVKVFRGKYA